MNIVNVKDYKAGDDVVLQLTGLDMEYYGDVVEVSEDELKVDVGFFDKTLTFTLKDGQKVTTFCKD